MRSILCFYCLVCQKKHMRQMPGEHNRDQHTQQMVGFIFEKPCAPHFLSRQTCIANFHFKSSNLIFRTLDWVADCIMTHYVLSVKSLVPVSCFWISLASKTWHYSVQIMFGQESPRGWWPTQSQQEALWRKHMTTSYCSNRLHLVSRRFWFVSLFNDET